MVARVAIVVLNYLNYKDTIECVDSIKCLSYPIVGTIIVDNCSKNDSVKKLGDRYGDCTDITIISTEKNIGYAQGNNIGIGYARRKWNAEYILVINNDTIITDEYYVDKFLSVSKRDVGIIDGKVRCRNGRLNKRFSIGMTIPALACRYLGMQCVSWNFEGIGLKLMECGKKGAPKKGFPQGCALMFTPAYFRFYSGFCPWTFLYLEEAILYIMLERAGLKRAYASDAVIFHKEDMSSQLSFRNDNKQKNRFEISSMKYVFLVKLLPIRYLQKKMFG